VRDSIAKVPNQELAKRVKCFFFFRWASSVLSESLMMVLAWNSSILRWAVHCPIAFFQVLQQSAPRTLWNYYAYDMALLGHHFVTILYACARNHNVATILQLSDCKHPNDFWRFVPTVRYFATQLLVLSSGCSHCHYELFHKISWCLLHNYCHICYHILPFCYSIAVRYM